MSVRDELQVEHERNKRRMEQKFEDQVRDTLSSEGMTSFMVSTILAAATGAIALLLTGIGAVAGLIIAAVLALLFAFAIDAASTETIRLATEVYGQNEDREDENYLRSIARLEGE